MKKIILLLILIMMPLAYGETVISNECATVDPYDYHAMMECQIDSYAQSGNKLMSDQIEYLRKEIVDSTKGTVINWEQSAEYFQIFRYLFVGLLVLITAMNGYQYIISNEDPTKREECKRTFKYIILSGIILVALPLIITETYNTSVAINTLMLHTSSLDQGYEIFDISSYTEAPGTGIDQSIQRLSTNYAQVPFFTTAARAYSASMNARHLMVLLLIALAPIILLAWVFTPTQEYGKLATYLFVIELFYPIANIILMHFSILLSGAKINLMIWSSALILSVALHIILILATIMKTSITVVNQIRYHEAEK